MKNKSQKNLIIEHIIKYGYVSRNYALRNYISRLSAIIYDLEHEGWEFETENKEENGGKNFYYHAVKCPPSFVLPQKGLFDNASDV